MAAISIDGDKALIKALADLAGPKMKAVIRKGTRAGQRPILDAVKQGLPKKTGTLQRSAKLRAMKTVKGRQGHTVSIGGVGIKEPFYGIFQEYGTKYIQAAHTLRDAADQNAGQALEITTTTIATGIDEIWSQGG